MSLKLIVSRLNTSTPNVFSYSIKRFLKASTIQLAKKAEKGPMSAGKKGEVTVEKDPYVLSSRLVGGNYLKEGEDPVLGPDEEYPDWLWDLKLTREATPLEELSQDDPRYWARLKKLTIKHNLQLKKSKKL